MPFQEERFLYLALVVPALFFLGLYAFLQKRKQIKRFGDPRLVDRLFVHAHRPLEYAKSALPLLAVLCITIALAGPQWGARTIPLAKRGMDIVFAVDVSRSMLAQDMAPSRLERAKMAITTALPMLKGSRVGLVLFAGASYIACPLTSDYNAFGMFVAAMHPSLISLQGTRIAEAIETAMDAFLDDGINTKAIILISDGEEHEEKAASAASAARERGARVYTMGVGMPHGAFIPEWNARGEQRGYKNDRQGKRVVTKLNESALALIAEEGGGAYESAVDMHGAVKRIVEDIERFERYTLSEGTFSRKKEQFQLFLMLALLFITAEFFLPERMPFSFKLEDAYE